MVVIAPILVFCFIVACFLAWQQWEYNRMFKENQKIALRSRMNIVTFNREEKIAAREWMF